MRYYRFTTKDHARTDFLDEVNAYYEVADDKSFVRSLEFYPDGVAYSYDLEHPADHFSILPDAEMDTAAAGEFGTLVEVTKEEFERVWRDTKVSNR